MEIVCVPTVSASAASCAAAAAAAAATWIRNSSNNSISTEHQLLFTADTQTKKCSAPLETTSSSPFLFLFYQKNSSYDLIALKEQRREESMPFHSLHAFHLFQTVSDHKVQIVITDKVNIHLYAQHCSVGSSTSNDIREDQEKEKYNKKSTTVSSI